MEAWLKYNYDLILTDQNITCFVFTKVYRLLLQLAIVGDGVQSAAVVAGDASTI